MLRLDGEYWFLDGLSKGLNHISRQMAARGSGPERFEPLQRHRR